MAFNNGGFTSHISGVRLLLLLWLVSFASQARFFGFGSVMRPVRLTYFFRPQMLLLRTFLMYVTWRGKKTVLTLLNYARRGGCPRAPPSPKPPSLPPALP